MIHKIFSPKIDYLEIGMRIEKPIIFRGEDIPVFYELQTKIKDLLGFKEEHKTEYGSKELYIFNGKNWEIRNKTQKIVFKGEAFYSQKQWIKIKMLLKIFDFYKFEPSKKYNVFLKDNSDVENGYTLYDTIIIHLNQITSLYQFLLIFYHNPLV